MDVLLSEGIDAFGRNKSDRHTFRGTNGAVGQVRLISSSKLYFYL